MTSDSKVPNTRIFEYFSPETREYPGTRIEK